MGIFSFPIRPRVNRVLRTRLAGAGTVLGGLSLAMQALFLPPDSLTQLHSPVPVSRPSDGKRKAGKVGWVGICLASVY
jgi:hypothetical protein